jgi:hypothetical protein
VSAPLVPPPRIVKLDSEESYAERKSVSTTVEIATLEISIKGRWDALALSQRLLPYHSFLVQYEPERWVVNGQTPGCHGERLTDALSAIEKWLTERHIDDASVRVDGRSVPLPRRQEDPLSAVASHRAANLQRRRRQGSDYRFGSLVA